MKIVTSTKRYLHIFGQLVLFTLKAKMEYRLNFAVQILYGPAYIGVLFIIANLAYSHSPTLLGWTKAEGMLLFAVFNLLYTTTLIAFLGGIRHLLWTGVREGIVDFALLKPVNPQFLLTFSKPEVQQIVLLAMITGFFGYQLWQVRQLLTLWSVLLFGVQFILGWLLVYLSLSTYATAAFVVTKASQIIEFFDKMTDYSTYPTPIFPASLQFILFSVIPTAFFGYIPTLFLLNRGNGWLTVATVVVVAIFYVVNQLAWKYTLRCYSSASS